DQIVMENILTFFNQHATQNAGGKTIYSALKIRQTHSHYETLVINEINGKENLKRVEAIIIEEVLIVSRDLFSFITNMLESIYNNSKIFERILYFGW
ncbi:2058_t:CDS:2, partial [Gigaspora rosea]